MIKRLTYNLFLPGLLLALLFLSGCDYNESSKGVKIPKLNPKYSYRDKEPMGGYIAYHYLNSLFENGVSGVTNKPFTDLRYEINYDQSLYIIVARSVLMNQADLESMLNYVSSGNTLFISAEYIDQKLIDTLETDVSFDFSTFLMASEYQMMKKDTWLSLVQEPGGINKHYGFYFVPFKNRFDFFDSSNTQVLGYDEDRDVNFVAIDHGQGKFMLHLAPAAFSNYFLLTNNNKEYLEKVFSHLKPETGSVYWDNFYRLRRSSDSDFSISGFFKKHPPLYFAFLIVLASLLLFLAFGGKRRQRFIPERVANINTTVSYTETIGRLYLQKKDNRNIALKMVTYFLEHVKNRYYLNTQVIDTEFAEALSGKSGVAKEKVQQLLQLMADTEQAENISDVSLLEVHNLVQEFYKK